jgi:cell division protein FtsB
MLVILAFRSWRQEGQKFKLVKLEASLRPTQKQKNKKTKQESEEATHKMGGNKADKGLLSRI